MSSHAEKVAELEASFGLFETPEMRAGLAALTASVQAASRQWAADMVTLHGLARRVPRSPNDDRGSTPWTSFVREVALARRVSDATAAADLFLAEALVRRHPVTLELLRQGRMPVLRARVLVEACAGWSAAVAAAVEERLAERACGLPPWRIKSAVKKIALALDADAAAVREAAAGSTRTASKEALDDGQAQIRLTGPAVQIARWWSALTERARALKAAGDPRSLGAIRFDLAMATDPSGLTGLVGPAGAERPAADARCSRPVQAHITVPVTTALGLGSEPGWLDGYGWISAPQCRQLLPLAELRQVCVAGHSGQPVDLAPRVVRPEPTPEAVRRTLLAMATRPFPITDVPIRVERGYAPSRALAEFVALRDRFCDGPTGRQVSAGLADKDHERRYPDGPTAAWNLVARARRTHLLKHNGWVPCRTATSTIWVSPAGQIAEVPRFTEPPDPLDDGAELPDPDRLHEIDAELCRPPDNDDLPPLRFPDVAPF